MASTFLSNFVREVGTTATIVVPVVPVAQVAIVFGLSGTNLLTTPVTATFTVTRANIATNVLFQATVPVGSSIVVAGNDQKIVLQAGDSLSAICSAPVGIDVICSYLLQS